MNILKERLVLVSVKRIMTMLFFMSLVGCASFQPNISDENTFYTRQQTQLNDIASVSAAVPSADEAEDYFDIDFESKGIQPVWLKIENKDDQAFYFLPIGLDPDYFSPNEVAWKSKGMLSDSEHQRLAKTLADLHIPMQVLPGETVEGFVYTNSKPGVKYLEVMLVQSGQKKSLEFLIKVPGIEADFSQVDFTNLYEEAGLELTLVELHEKLNKLPCCVFGGDKISPGDPLNLVIVGDDKHLFTPFIARGWHVTETMSGGSAWRTMMSSMFGIEYLTSPVSPLYVFNRSQDIALQKSRGSVDERNHMRLWLSPWKHEGRSVWVGQISRDIGVRLSAKTFVTHQIDADIDEARDYLLADLYLSNKLSSFAYLPKDTEIAGIFAGKNYTGDDYHSDGSWLLLDIANKAAYQIDKQKQLQRIDLKAQK